MPWLWSRKRDGTHRLCAVWRHGPGDGETGIFLDSADMPAMSWSWQGHLGTVFILLWQWPGRGTRNKAVPSLPRGLVRSMINLEIRVDVGPEFEAEGTLEFFADGKRVHTQAFEPDSLANYA